MYLLLWGAGDVFADDKPTMVDTIDAQYTCNATCMYRAIAREGTFASTEVAAEHGTCYRPNPGENMTGGLMLEYGRTFEYDGGGHEWCAGCGDLLSHGQGDDREHFTCNDAGCDAPVHVDPNPE